MSDEQTTPTPPEESKPSAEAMAEESKPARTKPDPEKVAAAKKAATKKPARGGARGRGKKKEDPPPPSDVSRREFLNLAWLSAMALLTVQTLGVSVLFLFPRFKEGEFGGIFPLQGSASDLLGEKDGAPVPFSNGKFWLTNTDMGVYAIYQVCTHLGCLYAWADLTARFECPCHGSKFKLTGAYIEGPAPRSLDRFKIIATRPDGSTIETPDDGSGIQLNGDETLAVDTGARISPPGRVEV